MGCPLLGGFTVFADLEKAFHWMAREVTHFALRQKGVPEYLVKGLCLFKKGCKTAASVDGELSSSFSMKIGIHQESALSPLLFIMVMDVLTEDVSDGSLMEFCMQRILFCLGNHQMRLWTSMEDGKMQWEERV